jgi:hypothetical protein
MVENAVWDNQFESRCAQFKNAMHYHVYTPSNLMLKWRERD